MFVRRIVTYCIKTSAQSDCYRWIPLLLKSLLCVFLDKYNNTVLLSTIDFITTLPQQDHPPLQY